MEEGREIPDVLSEEGVEIEEIGAVVEELGVASGVEVGILGVEVEVGISGVALEVLRGVGGVGGVGVVVVDLEGVASESFFLLL